MLAAIAIQEHFSSSWPCHRSCSGRGPDCSPVRLAWISPADDRRGRPGLPEPGVGRALSRVSEPWRDPGAGPAVSGAPHAVARRGHPGRRGPRDLGHPPHLEAPLGERGIDRVRRRGADRQHRGDVGDLRRPGPRHHGAGGVGGSNEAPGTRSRRSPGLARSRWRPGTSRAHPTADPGPGDRLRRA